MASAIQQNLNSIKSKLPEHVTLVAVSKTHPNEAIEEAYATGQRVFGENKVQEMTAKYEQLPKDIEWHLIGHLQTNKVKYMASFVAMIHAVDSLKLLKEINKRASQHDRTIDVLLQMHIAQESTKFGMDREELDALLASEEYQSMQNVRVRGLMGMATFTDNEAQVRSEFQFLAGIFKELKDNWKDNSFDTLSMGMSGDYELAIEEGSRMVRVGSSIFGQRNYG